MIITTPVRGGGSFRNPKGVPAGKGKVAIGKARYLLNIVFNTWWFKSTLFRKWLKLLCLYKQLN